VFYIPNEGYSGTDSFTYTISDGNGGTDTATVTVTVPSGGGGGGGGSGSISGRLWNDANQDGQQNEGESNFGDMVQVFLLDANGNTVASTYALGGVYVFSNIAAGQYGCG